MRKRIVDSLRPEQVSTDRQWLNLEELTQVEVTSEDASYPIEAALTGDSASGWRAEQPGRQTIRLLFDQPQDVRQIALLFREEEQPRTQEFVLRWRSSGNPDYREIVRQQYNFNPSGATIEHENYDVALDGLTSLELSIIPDISAGSARASLAELRIAS
jgi:hypothetical protein